MMKRMTRQTQETWGGEMKQLQSGPAVAVAGVDWGAFAGVGAGQRL